MSDFGFTPWLWTDEEQQQSFRSGLPPKTIDQLSPYAPIVSIYYLVRYLECTHEGPELTAALFRRLNSCDNNRLMIWDLWEPDASRLCPLAVVPSEDIRLTATQRDLMRENLKVDKNKGERAKTEPLVSHTLSSGLIAAQYAVGNQGACVYESNDWVESKIWELLHSFTKQGTLQHRENRQRDCASYRCPLWKVHKRLAEDDEMEEFLF